MLGCDMSPRRSLSLKRCVQVLGIIGWSGSGKTTLLTALIPCFMQRGLRVSTIKHAHHRFELDQPGKDSFLHRQAGAQEVIVANDAQFALFHAHRGATPGLAELLQRLEPVDLVLVEGFKSDPVPKLEVYRAELGRAPLWPETAVLAVAAEGAVQDCPYPVLPLNTPAAIADFMMRRLGLETQPSVEG
jgi:molybdopterin-guanine dinucleotide biosynthesis protein B